MDDPTILGPFMSQLSGSRKLARKLPRGRIYLMVHRRTAGSRSRSYQAHEEQVERRVLEKSAADRQQAPERPGFVSSFCTILQPRRGLHTIQECPKACGPIEHGAQSALRVGPVVRFRDPKPGNYDSVRRLIICCRLGRVMSCGFGAKSEPFETGEW
ncbi:hypothetical protein VTK73DRAFT_9500 [Phialemonium thermophilum]|uniref:Uncharacterized protein n=1 Tax=Phialemonium thermophilum TaxID=223376 RepID=A0ABR3Y497_9PEZI